MSAGTHPSLGRFAWLSIAAAVSTIALKTVAWQLTGSVGLLSDALESLVNLVAAVLTLLMLGVAARPPDEDHAYGHSKAEYFASGAEGALILLAACGIGWTAVHRLLDPQGIEQVGWGVAVSCVASVINFGVSRVLLRASQRYHSIALEADAHHLMTDVWTSAGVLGAVGLVALTGWTILDPIIGTCFLAGLLLLHAVRTRQAGARRFVAMHVLVPGAWTVKRGHELLEVIEGEVRRVIPNASVLTHLEALEDPASFQDEGLDRAERAEGG